MITKIKEESVVEHLRKNFSALRKLVNRCDVDILSALKSRHFISFKNMFTNTNYWNLRSL